MSKDQSKALDAIRNTEFVQAMTAMKEQKTKEAEEKFLSLLNSALFISPVSASTLDGDNRVNFTLVKDKSGKSFITAFTSMYELRKLRDEDKIQVVTLQFKQYLAGITSDPNGPDGIVIDCLGNNVVFPREILEGIKRNMDSREVKLKSIDNVPQEIIEASKAAFAKYDIINKAYIYWMRKGDFEGYFFAVDSDIEESDNDSRKALFNKLGQELASAFSGQNFTFAAANNQLKKLNDENEPIYIKE